MIINNLCDTSNMLRLFLILKIFIRILFNLVPIIVIIATTINLIKVVMTGSKDDIKGATSLSAKRIIAGLVVFFIPTILSFVVNSFWPDGQNLVSKTNQCFETASLEKVKALEEKEKADEEAKRKQQEKEDERLLKEAYEADQKRRDKNKQTFEEWKKEREQKNQEQATPEDEIQKSGDANIYFLNTGSSDCIIIESDGHYGMIDSSLESKSSYIINYLNRLGAKELDFVYLTHGHIDHTGGFPSIASRFKIKDFYIKTAGTSSGQYKGKYNQVINKAKQAGANIHDVSSSSSYTLGDINFYFYNRNQRLFSGLSEANLGRSENCNSTATVATVSGLRIYFAGDIGNYFGTNCESQTAATVGHVDVYKVAHHGYTSFNNHVDAIRNLSPTYSVITNAANNGYGRAASRIKDRSINPNFKALYVTGNGTVTLAIQKNGTFKFSQ